MMKLRALSLPLLAIGLSIGGCGSKSSDAGGSPAERVEPEAVEAGSDVAAGEEAVAAGAKLADGPDVCFRAVAKQLGSDAKVSEISSFFSAGGDVDGDAREAAGQMTICTVEYQNPNDPRKLLRTQLDVKSGIFGEPQQVEITVAGGDAATFKLEDYLIPLGQVNAAALKSVMDAQKAKLSGVYGKYAWTGVRLESPGAFNNKHTLRLDLTGRLASNDVKQNGYASITTDGRTITTNNLLP